MKEEKEKGREKRSNPLGCIISFPTENELYIP